MCVGTRRTKLKCVSVGVCGRYCFNCKILIQSVFHLVFSVSANLVPFPDRFVEGQRETKLMVKSGPAWMIGAV